MVISHSYVSLPEGTMKGYNTNSIGYPIGSYTFIVLDIQHH